MGVLGPSKSVAEDESYLGESSYHIKCPKSLMHGLSGSEGPQRVFAPHKTSFSGLSSVLLCTTSD